jgi:hypothetical protein
MDKSAWLPDFSWYSMLKRGKIYQMAKKLSNEKNIPTSQKNIPN